MRSQTQQTSRCKFIFPGRKIHQPWRLPGLWKVSRILKNSENRVGFHATAGNLERFRRFYQTAKVSGNLWQLFLFWILLRKLEYYGALLKEPFYMICIQVDVRDFGFFKEYPAGGERSPRPIGPRKSMQIWGSYPPNYARRRSGEKSTKIHEEGKRATRESLGCTRLSRRTNPSHMRAHRSRSGSAGGGVLAGCNGKAAGPGWRWPRGRNYTQSPHAS